MKNLFEYLVENFGTVVEADKYVRTLYPVYPTYPSKPHEPGRGASPNDHREYAEKLEKFEKEIVTYKDARKKVQQRCS